VGLPSVDSGMEHTRREDRYVSGCMAHGERCRSPRWLDHRGGGVRDPSCVDRSSYGRMESGSSRGRGGRSVPRAIRAICVDRDAPRITRCSHRLGWGLGIEGRNEISDRCHGVGGYRTDARCPRVLRGWSLGSGCTSSRRVGRLPRSAHAVGDPATRSNCPDAPEALDTLRRLTPECEQEHGGKHEAPPRPKTWRGFMLCGSRGERIRTSDLLLPKQALYRAKLRPDPSSSILPPSS